MRLLATLLLAATLGASVATAAGTRTVYAVVLFNRTEVVGASSMHSGLFHSTDDGVTWEHSGWENVRAFGADAIDSIRLIAAGNGVLRSTDNGAHWKVVTDWQVKEVLRVALFDDRKTIIAASAHGIWKSSDLGETWSQRNAGLKSTFVSSMNYDPLSGWLLIGTEEALYVSDDTAGHWTRTESPLLDGTGVLDIQRSASQPDVVFAATESRGIVRSLDGGIHWRQQSGGLIRTPMYSLAISPTDPKTVYAAGLDSGVWHSADGGNHWGLISGDSLEGKSFHGLAVSAAGTVIAGEYNGPIWRTNNGGAKWTSTGLPASQTWQVLER